VSTIEGAVRIFIILFFSWIMDVVIEMSRLTSDLPEDDDQNNLVEMGAVLKRLGSEIEGDLGSGLGCVDRCKWLIITPSCLFNTLLSWDVVGDQYGWDGSYWIIFLGVGVILMIWLLDNCFLRAKSSIIK
jgi:hypothetical protein